MRKLLLTAVIAVSLVACNNSGTKSGGSTDSSKTEMKAEEPKKDESTTSSTGMPKFSNPDIQKLADDYAAIYLESVEAAKSGDQAKMTEISTKMTDVATKNATAMASMSEADMKLWTDYFTKLATEQASKM